MRRMKEIRPAVRSYSIGTYTKNDEKGDAVLNLAMKHMQGRGKLIWMKLSLPTTTLILDLDSRLPQKVRQIHQRKNPYRTKL